MPVPAVQAEIRVSILHQNSQNQWRFYSEGVVLVVVQREPTLRCMQLKNVFLTGSNTRYPFQLHWVELLASIWLELRAY